MDVVIGHSARVNCRLEVFLLLRGTARPRRPCGGDGLSTHICKEALTGDCGLNYSINQCPAAAPPRSVGNSSHPSYPSPCWPRAAGASGVPAFAGRHPAGPAEGAGQTGPRGRPAGRGRRGGQRPGPQLPRAALLSRLEEAPRGEDALESPVEARAGQQNRAGAAMVLPFVDEGPRPSASSFSHQRLLRSSLGALFRQEQRGGSVWGLWRRHLCRGHPDPGAAPSEGWLQAGAGRGASGCCSRPLPAWGHLRRESLSTGRALRKK